MGRDVLFFHRKLYCYLRLTYFVIHFILVGNLFQLIFFPAIMAVRHPYGTLWSWSMRSWLTSDSVQCRILFMKIKIVIAFGLSNNFKKLFYQCNCVGEKCHYHMKINI